MFAENNGLVYKLINKYSKINSMYEYEDLIQEAYIGSVYAKDHYDSKYNMNYSSYLYMVLNHYLHKVVNHKNDNTSSLNAPANEDYEIIDLLEDNTINFAEMLFQSELRDLLQIKMDQLLTFKEKEVLYLYYWNNATLEVIAGMKGCSWNNIQRLLHQGLRKLRRDEEIQKFYKDNINEDYRIVFPR